MSTEEKAKAYDEALKRAKAAIDIAADKDLVGGVVRTILPELAESEDEIHRKWILEYLYDGLRKADEQFKPHFKSAIDWLEKQKYDRMKPIYDARESFESALEKAWNDYHNGYENVDKLEDDYVECAHAKGFREGYLFGIEKQKEQKEELVYRLNGLMQDYIKEGKDDEEKEHRLKCYQLFWDALEDASFFEQKEQKPNYCHYGGDPSIERCKYCSAACSARLTEEQNPVVTHGETYHVDTLGTQQVIAGKMPQKPELVQQPLITYIYNSNASRDERLKAALLALLSSDLLKVKEGGYFTKQDLIEWVERIPTDKPAWSEEDETHLGWIIECFASWKYQVPEFADQYQSAIDFLKSLRPGWKPSEEQMNALNFAITYMFSTKANPTVLRDLYNDLLKLVKE